jgi:hypothetical protein
MKSRWGVEIEGHAATITRLENYLGGSLKQASDTFVSRLRDVAVVRSALWDTVDDPAIVGQLAQTELALLQGLTKLAGGASPLGVGTVFELGPDDTILRQTRDSVNEIYALSQTVDPIPLFRKRMDAIRRHDALAGAVLELSGKPDWIKIYKAVEYLEEHYGGEKELAAAFPERKSALKRIKRTSQSVRHRARAFDKITSPYKLTDAEKYLQLFLKEIINQIAAPSETFAPDAFVVRRREFPTDEVIGLKPLILVNGAESEVAFVGDILSLAE